MAIFPFGLFYFYRLVVNPPTEFKLSFEEGFLLLGRIKPKFKRFTHKLVFAFISVNNINTLLWKDGRKDSLSVSNTFTRVFCHRPGMAFEDHEAGADMVPSDR